MKRKKALIFLVYFWASNLFMYAQDHVIYRDGRMRQVKIIQINNDKTLIKESDDKNATEEYIDNTKVFMLQFKTRGNVVFNSKGERILTTSESVQIPKDAIMVYYKDGRMMPAYNLMMDEVNLKYWTTKPGKGIGGLFGKKSGKNDEKNNMVSYPRTEVFMISYPDGTRDILTDIAAEEAKQRQREEEELRLKTEREAALADSIAAAEDEKAAAISTPKKATIITKAGGKLKVWICSETPSTVSYKKDNTAKAAIFKMSKMKIKKIQY